jgi:prepilin peptidase CpaA
MPDPFFPDPTFGWVFFGSLLVILAVAAYCDLRYMIIPKPLTLGLLALGLVFNVIRGALVGASGRFMFLDLGASNGWIGALDGLLFALSGFGLGLVVFLLMWILGTCGGGDVKLFAALGAWLGPVTAIFVLGGTLILVCLIVVIRPIANWLMGVKSKSPQWFSPTQLTVGSGKAPKQRLLTYSLPVALSTALVLLWMGRFDLNLASARLAPGPLHGQHTDSQGG